MDAMHLASDNAANLMIRALSAEADEVDRQLRSRAMAGPSNASARKALRHWRHELSLCIAGINTGAGVTRASA